MTYIKLLTVLAGLALLTACGGGTGLTATNDTITPECMTNPFGDGCNRFAEALASQEIMCLADATADPSCVGDAGIATVFCKANPFNTSKACVADTGAIALRQTMCLASATTDDSCGAVIEGVCMDDPFHSNNTCMADTYLPNRIAECIKGGEADEGKCATITTDAEKNTMVIGCLENPFDIVCQTSVTDFVTYADTARMNRLDFCDDNANVANDFCTGNNVTIICEVDPFNAICFTDDTYLSDRAEDCIMAGNAGESKCNNLFTASASNTCLTNPFADACASNADFMTYANMARTNRLTFCNDSDNVANGLCTGANLMNVCVADPFNAICFTDATYLPARITNCITGGNAGDMKCDTIVSDSTMNTELTDCLENPFATACESVSAFTTFALARTNRVSFCEIGGNESNALCMGASLMGVCGVDPFNAICFAEPTYLTARVNNCITGGNAGDMKCDTIVSDNTMNAEITACLTNPFTDACASNPDFDDYADMARANRVAFCESGSGELCTPLTTCQGNPFHESCGAYFESAKIPHCAIRTNAGGDCATTLSRPNAATWAQSFATELRATPTTGTGFLQGMETGLNTGDATTISHNIILNLATTTYEGVALGGDKEDGATYFIGNSGLNSYYYAGILSGTNLGAPLTETTGEATWNGRISARGAFNVDSDFNLAITFGGTGDIAGTLTAFASGTDSVSLPAYYKIDAEFDNKGLIIATEGNIIWNTFTDRNPETPVNNNNDRASGTLTGLIGQEGAVGVFILERAVGNGTGYYGGFVAAPPALDGRVDYRDWLDSFSPAQPATRTTGTDIFGGFLNLADGVRDISGAGLTAVNSNPHLTLDGNGTNGMHGVVYRAGKNGTNNQAFVAVLPTTNLGAPLTAQPTIGTWSGTYYNRDFANTRGIDFDIDFDANTIDAVHEATSPFALTTTFDLDFTPATGVITGTVTAGAGAGTATARGLIGTNGLVGVFVDTAPTGSIVLYGGFIADNPNN